MSKKDFNRKFAALEKRWESCTNADQEMIDKDSYLLERMVRMLRHHNQSDSRIPYFLRHLALNYVCEKRTDDFLRIIELFEALPKPAGDQEMLIVYYWAEHVLKAGQLFELALQMCKKRCEKELSMTADDQERQWINSLYADSLEWYERRIGDQTAFQQALH